ncbi:hypothetical protein C8N35_11632 [Breoghania corrubedonensis]|uniref:Uncharacterized protein n=1 Tax=Breoghania corrubedonensis TaxID=665038 RepID=A0A2T5UPY7_9HYPH|nr:hypothetical protein [Breoghania corrubedonensis]PTW53577.1 hypothetical protein C8N35_11632 [Breoghania corrubedonensis]
MKIIECINGPTEVRVGDRCYRFSFDANGRAVAEVVNLRHIECFLSRADVYREAEASSLMPADETPSVEKPKEEKTAAEPANDTASAKHTRHTTAKKG